MSFTGEPEPGKTTEERIKPRRAGMLMLCSLIAPIAVAISFDPGWSYWSMLSLFMVINYETHGGFYFYPTIYLPWGVPDIFYLMNISMVLGLYAGPRIVFSYQTIRLYKGRTSKRKTLLLGFMADCYFLIIGIPTMIYSLTSPYFSLSLILPIPVALFIFLILLKLRPPAVVITPWKGVDKPQKWWEEKATPTLPPATSVQSPKDHKDGTKPSKPKSGDWWDEEEKDKKSSEEPTSPW